MDAIIQRWKSWRPSSTVYAPLAGDNGENSLASSMSSVASFAGDPQARRVLWAEYAIFTLLGIAMLWTWYVHTRPLSP